MRTRLLLLLLAAAVALLAVNLVLAERCQPGNDKRTLGHSFLIAGCK